MAARDIGQSCDHRFQAVVVIIQGGEEMLGDGANLEEACRSPGLERVKVLRVQYDTLGFVER